MANACSEDRAEWVSDKEKANFCDYFSPVAKRFASQDNNAQRQAEQALADLFGEADENAPDNAQSQPQESESDKALRELKNLFGDD